MGDGSPWLATMVLGSKYPSNTRTELGLVSKRRGHAIDTRLRKFGLRRCPDRVLPSSDVTDLGILTCPSDCFVCADETYSVLPANHLIA
jgi:hypothetical protein